MIATVILVVAIVAIAIVAYHIGCLMIFLGLFKGDIFALEDKEDSP